MQRGGIGNHDGIGLVIFERFLKVSFDRIACQLVIGQGGFASAQQNDIFFAKGDQVAEMTAANRAEACDEDFHNFVFASHHKDTKSQRHKN
jgi:hypothetical protein